MLITLKNTQRQVKIDKKWLVAFASRAMEAAGFAGWGLSIWITTDRTIRQYNRRFRHQDKATDILSFPFYPDLLPGKRPQAHDEDERYLGDLIISAERVAADAAQLNVTVEARLEVLVVHGICHLLGYDHETETQYRVMQRQERNLLAKSR
ncbi:MAG: rRNA maturation RNase YbeY [Candidatus Dependentiae bacterium]|nr:rRNA maturation RNase YbeY [Candidatus Dependentiae bacterium]